MTIPVPFGSKMQIPPKNHHLLATQQKLYKKVYLLIKIPENFRWVQVGGGGGGSEDSMDHYNPEVAEK